jgi:hypothetical protein
MPHPLSTSKHTSTPDIMYSMFLQAPVLGMGIVVLEGVKCAVWILTSALTALIAGGELDLNSDV